MSNIQYDGSNISNARNLRRNMTREERHLWYDFLRTYPVKFYRQRMIGNYIVDFYCSSALLIVELDGGQHYSEENIEYDRKRTLYLNEYNIKVLRFNNTDVMLNFEGVCFTIDKEIKTRNPSGAMRQLP